MIHVRENVVCLFGGCGSNEDMFKTNTPILLNDLYFLNIGEWKLLRHLLLSIFIISRRILDKPCRWWIPSAFKMLFRDDRQL